MGDYTELCDAYDAYVDLCDAYVRNDAELWDACSLNTSIAKVMDSTRDQAWIIGPFCNGLSRCTIARLVFVF